jgi:uncharacterized protein with HEPN domain
MTKDPKIFLTHILDSIHLIERYLQNVTEEQFLSSDEKQDLTIRRLEIIGEATKNIPMEFREEHSEIPWKRMAGMRDIVIHQYYDVDYTLVWDTVTKLLPDLKTQIEKLLAD